MLMPYTFKVHRWCERLAPVSVYILDMVYADAHPLILPLIIPPCKSEVVYSSFQLASFKLTVIHAYCIDILSYA